MQNIIALASQLSTLNAEALAESVAKVPTGIVTSHVENHADIVNAAVAIYKANSLPVHSNLTADESGEGYLFPAAGYGVAIVPQRERPARGEAFKYVSLIVCTVPTLNTISQHEQGQAWITERLEDALIRRIRYAMRDDSASAADLPGDVDGFSLDGARGTGLGTWNDMSADAVRALKNKNPNACTGLTRGVLKMVLESQAIAEVYFPRIPAENWETVIKVCRNKAVAIGKTPRIFDHWMATRNETAERAEVDTFSFDMDGEADQSAINEQAG